MIVALPDGRKVKFPDGMPKDEIKALIKSKFPNIDKPMYEAGQPAAEDDALGVGASGVSMPTEYGRTQSVRSYAQGLPFVGSFMDEVESFFTGIPSEQIRSEMKQYNIESEGAGTTAEMVGAVMSPLGGAQKLAKVIGSGFSYGAGKAEGDLEERAVEGLKTAAVAVPFTYLTTGMLNLPGKALKAKSMAAERKQTVESATNAYKQAYKDADLAGVLMSPRDTLNLTKRVRQSLDSDVDWNPQAYNRASKALQMVEKRNLSTMTFEGLEDLNRKLWKEYNAAKVSGDGNEMGYILKIINEVDDTIAQLPLTHQKLKDARYMFKQSQKINALDAAIDRADLQAKASGSGGNTVNAYLQAVKRLLSDPKKSRFFSEEEKQIMREFIRKGGGSGVKRALSKLAPSGNGLMFALAGVGSAMNPKLSAMFAGGALAKISSEADVERNLQKIFSTYAKGTPAENIIKPPLRVPETMAPIVGSEYGSEYIKGLLE